MKLSDYSRYAQTQPWHTRTILSLWQHPACNKIDLRIDFFSNQGETTKAYHNTEIRHPTDAHTEAIRLGFFVQHTKRILKLWSCANRRKCVWWILQWEIWDSSFRPKRETSLPSLLAAIVGLRKSKCLEAPCASHALTRSPGESQKQQDFQYIANVTNLVKFADSHGSFCSVPRILVVTQTIAKLWLLLSSLCTLTERDCGNMTPEIWTILWPLTLA